jgi:putative NADH-flavin reductase
MKLAILGASGRTGRLIVEQALARGDEVRALVRSPAKLGLSHPRLEFVQGDATDADAVRRLVQGCDAVVSALGPVGRGTDICSVAARNVIAAGTPRYVAISGAGIDVPGDKKDLGGRIGSFFVRTLLPAAFRDKVREHALLEQSTLAWTLVRAPRLMDKPGTGQPRVSLERSPGNSVSRAALAGFVLRCLEDDSLVRKAPFIAG